MIVSATLSSDLSIHFELDAGQVLENLVLWTALTCVIFTHQSDEHITREKTEL